MRLIAPTLLAVALLCACGEPPRSQQVIYSGVSTATLTMPPVAPTRTPNNSPPPANTATPAPKRDGPVPRPSPDPAAVAAGAPLRATLLDQLAEAERRCAVATPGTTPGTASPCRLGLPGPGDYRPSELVDYLLWHNAVRQCRYNPSGSTAYVFTAAALSFTLAELRDPAMLDVFVAGTPWCDVTRDRIPGRVPAPTPRP